MSFGLSISDLITAIELANRIRKTFVDAPSQFKNISDEVRSLSIVLQDVEVVLSERELTSQQKMELHDIADGCHKVLDELERILDKYRELSSGLEDARKKVKRVWKRLKWEPEDIRELRSRICSNITLFNAFNGQLIRDNTVKLVRHKDDQERRTILDWLTPTDYGTQQSDFISRRQEGTGQWLLDSDKFQAWLNTSKQTLFCPGIPGAGKTTITSIIVEHLQNNFRNNASIGIAYLYCNFRRQQEQKPADLLASVLKQLIQRRPSVPESITTLYKRHNDERTRPSFDEISKVLHSVVADYSQTFIIIDALDECQVSDGGRQRILAEISNLQTKTRANLFATSRFIPEIMKEFEGSVALEIRASGEDVQRYLDGHMSRLPSFVLRSPDLQEEIKTEIMKAVDGMFLLAQLHLDSLIGKKSPKAIRSTLKTLSTGSGAYDRAYKEAMERIEGQIADSYELATQVLLWITCAKRPLTTLELRHALAIEVGELTFDEENLPEIEDMVSVCAGLVIVDEKSDIIRLVHYTTQEYFERTWITWFPGAQRNIAMNCVTYLSFDVFETGFCRTDKEFETRLQLYPLYDYAARNWGYHARAALAEVEQFILDFLNSAAKISGSSQAMMAFKDFGYHGYSQEVPRQLSGVHLAAYFGLREVIIALLKNGDGPNVKDTYGQTPLSWAAANGRETVVKLLLANDDVDPECKDKYDQTPLSRAAEYGREEVVKLLLVKDRVNLNSKDSLYGRTPLAWAAESGHDRMVKLLLATDGVDPDSKNTDGETPLLLTARNGHEAAVKLLLTKDGVDFNTKDKKHGRTPLSCAAENGHEAVVKLLLAKNGVDSNSKDTGYGRTPLSWAAANGHEAVVKLLLATDNVNLNPKDNNIRTPLWWAAKNGHEGVMKLLLAKDAVKPDSKDIDGRTPLSWAVENGHEEMVKLLLATDSVDPDSKDEYGWTPLSWAAVNGHEAVVRLLLAKVAVDPDSKDNDDRTPLSKAAWKGHEAVVKLLLATNSVDPDSQATNYGLTPLWWAVWNGHKEVVTMLLATDGVDPDSKETEYGRTPLSLAAANGAEAVVRLLLTNVAVDPDFKDKHGRSPLCWASRNGHKAVVELLLAKDGVDSDSKDNNGRTPLLLAARYGHEKVVRLLLTKDGVDVNSKDKDGRTPLFLAAAKKREQWMRNSEYEIVVELLLASNCVDVNTKDTSGRTPLSWAAGEGHYARVKLLLAKNGIDPNSKDDLGQTPLWWATKNGHQSVIKMLAARPLDS